MSLVLKLCFLVCMYGLYIYECGSVTSYFSLGILNNKQYVNQRESTVAGQKRQTTSHVDGQECAVNLTHICAFVAETHAQTDIVARANTHWFTPFGSLPEAQLVSQCQSASVSSERAKKT